MDNRLTRHNPAAYDQKRDFVCDRNAFPVFRKSAEAIVAASGDQEDVVFVSEGFDVLLSLHFLLQDTLSLHHTQKQRITLFTTWNKSDARNCSTWKTHPDALSVLVTNWFRCKNKMTFSVKILSFGSKIVAAVFARYQ